MFIYSFMYFVGLYFLQLIYKLLQLTMSLFIYLVFFADNLNGHVVLQIDFCR